MYILSQIVSIVTTNGLSVSYYEAYDCFDVHGLNKFELENSMVNQPVSQSPTVVASLKTKIFQSQCS